MNIIMNPPYGSLHLKILDKVIKACPNAETVNLSPIRWLQDPLAEYKKNSDYKRFADIRKHIESVDEIPMVEATNLFGAAFTMDLGILHITEKGGWDNNTYKNKIVDKIVASKCIGIPVTTVGENKKKCFAMLSLIVGDHSGFDNLFKNNSIIQNEKTYGKYYVDGKSEMNGLTVAENKERNKRSVHGSAENFSCVGFDTEEEIKNFYCFTFTKLFKYVLINTTVDVHVHPQFLPFMPTYKHEWTDEMLYEYFGLTEEEIEEIEKCSL